MQRAVIVWLVLLLSAPAAWAQSGFFFDSFEQPERNLSITAAAFSASAEVGYPYQVFVTVRAQRAATGTVVNVLLVPFNPASDRIQDINPLAPDFIAETSPVAVVGGHVIPALAAGEELQIDIKSVLNIDYDNPDGTVLPPGTYVPVVMFDALGETEHASEEGFRWDDYRVASGPITVAASSRLPALEVTRFRSDKPYFFDPDPEVTSGDALENGAPAAVVSHIRAELALQAYGAAITTPVEASFSVEIPSLAVPGTVEQFAVAIDNPELTWPEMTHVLQIPVDPETGHSFGVTEDMPSWPPPENHTPSLRSTTLNLQLPEAARDLLVSHGRDIEVLVRVNVGAPAFSADVFKVIYLQQDPVPGSPEDKSGQTLVSQGLSEFYGASNPAGAGYAIGFSVVADKSRLRAETRGNGRAYVQIFGASVDLLNGSLYGSIDPAEGAYYISTVAALGRTIASIELSAGTYSRSVDLSYSRNVEYTQRFNIGPVPASVTVGARGTGGIQGSLTATPTTLNVGVGPEIDIAGYARFSAINLGRFKAGIGADLLFLNLSNRFAANATYNIPVNRLEISYSGPLALRTLDGKVYAYATLNYVFGKKRWSQDIVSWRGLRKTWNWFQPRTIVL